MMSVAFLGPPGTYSEEAARLFARALARHTRRRPHLSPCATLPDVLWEAARGRVDLGVVPLENALEGAVGLVSDMLVHEVDLKIWGEVVLPIRHALLARPDTAPAAVETITSHPQALAQCRSYLARHFPHAELIPASSTAEAARRVRRSRRRLAAIGSPSVAGRYHLVILARDLQGNKENATRFVALAHTDRPPCGHDKTSIVVAPREDRPGVLYEVLGEFARRGINLTRIESRPARRTLGEYVFLIDFEGHRLQPQVADTLQGIAEKSRLLKVLGSYPRAETPAGGGA